MLGSMGGTEGMVPFVVGVLMVVLVGVVFALSHQCRGRGSGRRHEWRFDVVISLWWRLRTWRGKSRGCE